MTLWYGYIDGCVYYDSIMLYYCLITFWKLKCKMIQFVDNFMFFFCADLKQVYIVLVHNRDMQVCVQLFSAGIFSFQFTTHTFHLRGALRCSVIDTKLTYQERLRSLKAMYLGHADSAYGRANENHPRP